MFLQDHIDDIYRLVSTLNSTTTHDVHPRLLRSVRQLIVPVFVRDIVTDRVKSQALLTRVLAEDLRRNLQHALEEVWQVVVLEDGLETLVDGPEEVWLQRLPLSLGQGFALSQLILHASHFCEIRHEHLSFTLGRQLSILFYVLRSFVAALTVPVDRLQLLQDRSRNVERALSSLLHAAHLLSFPLVSWLLLQLCQQSDTRFGLVHEH